MTGTIHLIGPREVPGASPISANDINTAVNAALATKADNTGVVGAFGDGASHPASSIYPTLAAAQAVYPHCTSLTQEIDWLAWQSALNRGGLVTDAGQRHFIMCNAAPASMTPLTMSAGQSWVEGNGSILDFSAIRTQPVAQHMVANRNFTTSANWVNDTFDPATATAVFGGGAATSTDTPFSFTRFGQQVTLPAGNYVLSWTVTATLGASYAAGNVNQPYGLINFWKDAPGVGFQFPFPPPDGLNFPNLTAVITAGAGGVTFSGTYNFNIAAPYTGFLCFTGGGYANWKVTELDIIPFVPNCGLLVTRDNTTGEHYNLLKPIRGLELIGYRSGLGVGGVWTQGSTAPTAVLFQSFVAIDGNLLEMQDCSIHEWGNGIWPRDGAYLMAFRNVSLYNCDCAVIFTGGQNAGENIRFYGGGIFNNLWGIMNPHSFGEFTFYGTALDYNFGSISNNAGKLEFHGCHIENNIKEVPIFHCTYGQVTLFGGIILGVAPTIPMASVVPPIQLDTSNALVSVFGTAMYNLTSADGTFVGGIGSFRAYGWINQGNASIARPSATTIAMDPLGGAGSLEPMTAFFNGTDPTGIFLEGGIYPDIAATITNRWTTDKLTVALSTAQKHTGTRSLLVSKLAATSADYQIVFLVPVRPGQDANFSFWYQAPTLRFPAVSITSITRSGSTATATSSSPHGVTIGTNYHVYQFGATQPEYNGIFFVTITTTTAWTFTVSGTPVSPATGTLFWSGTAPVYARTWWAKQIGVDAFNRPVLSPAATFMGETDIYLAYCGRPEWFLWSTGTQYNPPSTIAADGKAPGAPVWATHLAVTLDTEGLPDWAFHLDDFVAYVI